MRPGAVAVGLRACVGARRRTAGRLRPGPTPVGTERILARGLPRTGLIPWASHSACRAARRAGRRRAVRAVGTRRYPAPVRQPVLPARYRPAVRRTPVHRAPVRGARGHGAAVARRAIRRQAVSGVSGRRREAARRRAHARAARLVEARLGRHLSGAPQQLAVRRRRHRPARSGRRRRPPGRRGVHPGVFAWAGHRHRGPGRCRHVPPGTSWAGHPAAPQDMPYLTSVGREKSPVGPRRSIVINCT